MSIAPIESRDPGGSTAEPNRETPDTLDAEPVKRAKRRSTSHLKAIPETLALRERIRDAAERFAEGLDKSRLFNRNELEQHGRALLGQLDLPEKFLGFAMVMLGNFFWKRQFLSVPFERRMLLLPHCLKHAAGCPADYDEFGLDCEKCGACSIADYKVRAEEIGYKVLVAEGSPVVLKIIVSGHINGILGVACLNVLEKAIEKVLIAGVPSYAIPLHSGDCKNTSLDESWVWDVLDKYEPLPQPLTQSYVPLMRVANRFFEGDFSRLIPRFRSRTREAASSPLGRTEDIALDWLANGGKRFRPFITLAAYDAMTGGKAAALGSGDPAELQFSDAVSKAAMAIEVFHKASLVHDDIEDDDQFRYGHQTLHRRHGIGTAINIDDYLIGLGYRLVNSARTELGAEVASDILERMAAAHIKLCDGQGAEMAWNNGSLFEVTPLDALQIYALKTAPAFEAALYAGIRMAGEAASYDEPVAAFVRQLGVGFQILNDLKDWRGDQNNKLLAGQDALALRPTVLFALAVQAADATRRQELLDLLEKPSDPTRPQQTRIAAIRRLFEQLEVFEKAEALVEKSRARAETVADAIEPEPLRRLLYFLVDTVLASEAPEAPFPSPVLVPLPIAGA